MDVAALIAEIVKGDFPADSMDHMVAGVYDDFPDPDDAQVIVEAVLQGRLVRWPGGRYTAP